MRDMGNLIYLVADSIGYGFGPNVIGTVLGVQFWCYQKEQHMTMRNVIVDLCIVRNINNNGDN
jgi:hypothetical protein